MQISNIDSKLVKRCEAYLSVIRQVERQANCAYHLLWINYTPGPSLAIE